MTEIIKIIKQILYFTIFIFSCNFLYSNEVYENFGLTRSEDKTKIYLTIDLCPSQKAGYNEDLFNALVELSKLQQRPIPIAIAISGRWIINHQQALKEIKAKQKLGYLDIVWINHSYAHHYNPKDKKEESFMLHDISSALADIKKNRKTMKDFGLKPSNFFRFPGLISNDYLNNLVQQLGYTILGADAWLAKTGGKFHGGDIILIHGNLNEQIGVNLFLKNLKEHKFALYQFASIEDFNQQETPKDSSLTLKNYLQEASLITPSPSI
ncbi:MAG: polysaccharide deacetylase family protein [Alphaproteobacteria bacterium]|nr:polysaccharide deacetylase family protein [Alphaproteobacteria bacterium]